MKNLLMATFIILIALPAHSETDFKTVFGSLSLVQDDLIAIIEADDKVYEISSTEIPLYNCEAGNYSLIQDTPYDTFSVTSYECIVDPSM